MTICVDLRNLRTAQPFDREEVVRRLRRWPQIGGRGFPVVGDLNGLRPHPCPQKAETSLTARSDTNDQPLAETPRTQHFEESALLFPLRSWRLCERCLSEGPVSSDASRRGGAAQWHQAHRLRSPLMPSHLASRFDPYSMRAGPSWCHGAVWTRDCSPRERRAPARQKRLHERMSRPLQHGRGNMSAAAVKQVLGSGRKSACIGPWSALRGTFPRVDRTVHCRAGARRSRAPSVGTSPAWVAHVELRAVA